MTRHIEDGFTSKCNYEQAVEIATLAVAIETEFTQGLSITHVPTGWEAIELLTILRFDLLLLSADVPDMSPWELADKVRHFWPWQRWALVAPNATDADFRLAGERGASGVFTRLS